MIIGGNAFWKMLVYSIFTKVNLVKKIHFVQKCLLSNVCLMVFNNLYMEMSNLYNIHMDKNRWVENSFWTKMLI
jgi:hypothetical protein